MAQAMHTARSLPPLGLGSKPFQAIAAGAPLYIGAPKLPALTSQSQDCRYNGRLSLKHRHVPSRALHTVQASAIEAGSFKLVIYSKPGCCLCDGLKEKVSAVLQKAQFQPSLLTGADIEVRDITTRPEWEQAYAMEIPVLAHASLDNSNEKQIPRPAPRLSADRLEKHIISALTSKA